MPSKKIPSAPERRSSIWIVINLLLVGAAVYILYKRQHAPAEAPIPGEPAAVSTPPPSASPSPIVAVASTPAPMTVAATPEPRIALSTVDRRALPRQVLLLKPVDFIILSQGQQVGSVHAAAGVWVDLVDVASDGQIEVQMGGIRQTIPAADTDIESRVRQLLKYQ